MCIKAEIVVKIFFVYYIFSLIANISFIEIKIYLINIYL
jgi:hypothetical protein